MKKKLLAILVAVCLVIAMVPATVFAANNPYTDVASGAWYYDEVMCVTERGLMTHTGDNAFEPGTYTTRGMLMTILARLGGVDTSASSPWYKAGMDWAVANGVSDGTNPTGLITREQIVTMLYRYENSPYGGASLTGFVDSDDVSDWAQAAVEWAVYVGLLEGKDGGRLDPTGTATRAELAAILCRHAHLDEGTGGGGGHTHRYDGEKYGYASNNDGTHSEMCRCGKVSKKNGDTSDCTYENGVCTACGYEDPSYVPEQTPSIDDSAAVVEAVKNIVENFDGSDIVGLIEDLAAIGLTPAQIAEATGIDPEVIETVLDETATEQEKAAAVEGVDADAVKDALNEALEAVEYTEKFYLGVTAGETADFTAYDDYSFLINLPAGDLTPGTVTLTAEMNNVASLGGGVKSHTITVNTGLTGSPSLYDYLNSGFQALSGSIVANITDDGVTKSVTYAISGDGDGTRKDVVITGTADTDEARAAWQHMTENVDTSTQSADDSYILINGGSYLQLGGEILVFEDDVDELKLDNFNSLSALKQTIKDAVTLKDAEDNTIVAVLTAGTELAVGSSIATLNEDVTITVSGVEVEEGVLSDIRALAQADEDMAMAKKLMSILDAVLASAVENGTVTVDIEFTEPVVEPEEEVYEKFYLGVTAGETADVTVYSDYSFLVNLPAGDLTPGTVTLTAEMNNVASLGVTGTKSHTVTVNTGLNGSPSLYDYLNSGFQALSGSIVANITDDGVTKSVTYAISGDGDGTRKDVVITGTADTDEARAAWQHMTENVDTSTQSADDSYILINGGSYLQLGGEILVFEDGVDSLKLDNFNSLSALKQSIKDAVTLDVAEDDAIVAVLTAGTELAVGSSIATLNEDVTITVSGVEVEEGVLSDIRALAQADEDMAMAKKLMSILDAVLASAVENGTVTVDIEFANVVAVEPVPGEPVYEKFYLGVTAGETADVTVYSDYSVQINLPCGDLTPGTVTLTAEMTDVASLGVTGTKSHTVTVNTGLNGSPSLYDYLNSGFQVLSGSIVANITAGGQTESVTYTVSGNGDGTRKDVVITATADTDAARAAWQLLTSNVSTDTQGADDSYILINGGSSLQLGGEILVFEDGVDSLKLDNFNSLSALKQSIKDAVTLKVAEDDTIVAVLTAGTQLAVGSSVATLTQDVTITISGVEVEDGVLSDIRDLASADEDMAMAKKLVSILDAVLASAVDNGTVTVDIVFG